MEGLTADKAKKSWLSDSCFKVFNSVWKDGYFSLFIMTEILKKHKF